MAQVTERGYLVSEVSGRLGVSPHSLYAWKRQFAKRPEGGSKDAEIRQLKRELLRMTEEGDIPKKPPRVSPGMQVRYAFVAEHRTLFSMRAMWRCLLIQPSGFYS